MESRQVASRSWLSFVGMLALTFVLAVLLFGATSAWGVYVPPAAAPDVSVSPLSGSVQVTITESGFDPEMLTVTVGTEVTWYNATAVTQKLRSGEVRRIFLPIIRKSPAGGTGTALESATPGLDSPGYQVQGGEIFSGTLPPGGTLSYVFNEIGEYPYYLATLLGLTGRVVVEPIQFDFDLSAWPEARTVVQGQEVTYTVHITGTLGSPQPVILNVGGLPTGAVWDTPSLGVVPTATTVITVYTTLDTPLGDHALVITGTAGTQGHTAAVTLSVTPHPDFELDVTPPMRSIAQGQSVTYTAMVTGLYGFGEPVLLSVEGLPVGAEAAWEHNPLSPTAGTALTVTTHPTTPVGTQVFLAAGSGGGFSHQVPVTLEVTPGPDFAIDVQPPAQAVAQTHSVTYTVNLTSEHGFAEGVALAVQGLPEAATAQWDANPVTPTASSVLTISASSSTPVGPCPLVVLGEGGELSHSVGISLNVLPQTWPDLVVQSITTDPITPTIDEPLTLTVTVGNRGTETASGPFLVDWYADPASPPVSTTVGDGSWAKDSLPAGWTADLTATHVFTTAAAHTLYAQVDRTDLISEMDEGNNVGGPVTVTVVGPDLIVQGMVIDPAAPIANIPFTLTVIVENQGQADAGTPFRVDWYADPTLPITSGTPSTGGWTVDPLGVEMTQTLNTTYTFATAGAHALYAQVNVSGTVAESNGGNNISAPLPISVDSDVVNICGTISQNTTWRSGVVYIGTCDVTVNPGVTLTVEPAVTVKFDSGAGLTVNGTLLAEGTEAAPVYITSLKDDSVGGDTNGDGTATVPARGDWDPIDVGGVMVLDHTTVRYGGRVSSWPGPYNGGNIRVEENGQVTLNHSTISESGSQGIRLSPASCIAASHVLTASDSVIENNTGSGIGTDYCLGGTDAGTYDVTVTRSTIRNNGGGGVAIGAGAVDHTVLSDNNIYGNSGYGVSLYGAAHLSSISNNLIEGNGGGVSVGGLYTLTLTANQVNDNRDYGVMLSVSGSETFSVTANTISGNGTNGLGLVGAFNQDTTLPTYSPDSVYVGSYLTVNPGVTLTLPAGLVLKMADAGKLTVQGTLLAQGTESAPVYITSYRDDSVSGDTNGDGTATVPAPGDWDPIEVSGVMVLDHATVRYGGRLGYWPRPYTGGNIRVRENGQVTLNHSTISESGSNGIRLSSSSCTAAPHVLTASDSMIENNTGSGIGTDYCGNGDYDPTGVYDVTVNRSTIRNNGQGGVAIGMGAVDHTVLSNNSIYGNGYGVSLYGTAHISSISNNYIEGNGGGISASGAYTLTLNANQVNNNHGCALTLDVSSGGTFSLAGNTLLGNDQNGPCLVGTVIRDTALPTYSPDSLYIVGSYLTVNPGVTLTLPAGLVLKMADTGKLTVNGTLWAQGTETAPVYVTSYRDDSVAGDTNGDGTATVPARGDWDPIDVSGTMILDHTFVRFGGRLGYWPRPYTGGNGNIHVWENGQVTLNHSTISESGSQGIRLSSGSCIAAPHVLTASDSVIENNTDSGIGTDYCGNGVGTDAGTYDVTATRTTIRNNGQSGIVIGTGAAGHTVLSDNSVYGNSSSGVVLYGAAHISSISNNHIEDNGGGGISVSGAYTLTLDSNRVDNNASYGVTFDLSNGGTFSVAGNTVVGNGTNGLCLVGAVSQDTALPTYSPDSVYVVGYYLSVNPGVTLTLPAGLVLKMADAGKLTINGTLLAQGTETAPVYITSYRDDAAGGDTNGDGTATVPARGDWDPIDVSGVMVLDHTSVRYGGRPHSWSMGGNILVGENAQITLNNSVVSESATEGIRLGSSACTVAPHALAVRDSVIENNTGSGIATSGCWSGTDAGTYDVTVTRTTIRNNGQSGVVIGTGAADHTVLSDNSIYGNGGYGVSLYGTGNVSSVSNNLIEGNGGGISASGLYTLTLNSNQINNNRDYGVMLYVSGSETFSVTANTISGNGTNGLGLVGAFNQDTTLPTYSPDSVYVGSYLTVNPGVTLTLPAGLVLKMPNAGKLIVNGTLLAQGTESVPVYITSYRDDAAGGDTNGDGTATVPARGDWDPIDVGGVMVLDHTSVRYGGRTNYWSMGGNILVGENAQVTLNNSVVSESATEGIRLGSSACTVAPHALAVRDSVVENNTGSGIATSGCWSGTDAGTYDVTITRSTIRNNGGGVTLWAATGSAVLSNNNIYGNAGYGVYNGNTSQIIHAENNYWGSDDGPAPHGHGNGINYKTCYDDVLKKDVPCQDYVSVWPWVGAQYQVSHSNGKLLPAAAYVAEPVNTANGNYTYAHTDLSIPTYGLLLEFARSYNALLPQDGPLGWGWTHTYAMTATESISESAVYVTYGDGRQDRFIDLGGTYQSPTGTFSTLTKAAGLFRLTLKDQTAYHFHGTGRLASIADRNGNTTALAYSGDQLTTVTEPSGRTLTFSYTGPHLTQVQDLLGRTVAFGYDAGGNLTGVTDVTGQTTTFTYDGDHRLLTATDANGHTFVTNVYNSTGKVVEQRDAKGNKTTFAYDEVAHVTVVVDPRGNATTYTYDADYRLVQEKDALGNTVEYTYDAQNNRTAIKDRRGNTSHYTYDDRGNVLSATDPLSHAKSFSYDARNNPLTETDARGHTTTYEYDAHGNLTRRTDALSHETTWTYNAHGQPETMTDARSHTTTYGYDAGGNRTLVRDALSRDTTYTFDAGGRKLTETDPLGHTTTYTYDAANRLIQVTDALSGVTRYTYDAVGNRTEVQDANGHTTHYDYDEKDRLVSVTDPLGHATSYTYDAVDNQTALTDPLGRTTTFAYDALNHRTSVADPLGKTTSYQYDANGNRTRVTDANGHVTNYAYDAANQLTSVTDAASGTVNYTYDANGNRTSMQDANNHATTYTYDELNRLASITDPLGQVTAYAYDAVGNRTGKTKPDGTTITYGYDDVDRMVSVSGPGLSISYAYDAAGNRTGMTDATGTTAFVYDALNRLTGVTYPDGRALGYAYDAAGNRTGITYPGARSVSYSFDDANQMTGVTDWDAKTVTYGYDTAGQVTGATYPNGTIMTYTHDIDARVTGLVHGNSGGPFASFGYTYDDVGNRLSEVSSGSTTSYSYDTLDRLKQVNYPGGENVTYAYGPMGNRTTKASSVSGSVAYTYDAGDRLQTAGPDAFTWDVNGNQLSRTYGPITSTYEFDPLDRLTQVVTGTTTVGFTYNGDGVRVGKAVSGTATSYVQDLAASLPVVLVETTGGQDTMYIYGLDLIAQVEPGGSRRYYHTDALGSVRALTDDAGQVVATYTYDAFGAVRAQTDGSGNSFTFTGEQADDETGLVFLRARYCDPMVGRFISKDLLTGLAGSNQSANRYVYALNNPVRLVDRSGNKPHDSAWDRYGAAALKATESAVSYGSKALSYASTLLKVTGRGASEMAENIGAASDVAGILNTGVELAEFAAEPVPDDLYSAYRSAKHDLGREPTKGEVDDYMQYGFDIEYKQVWMLQKSAEGLHLAGGNPIADWLFPLPKVTTKANDEDFARWYQGVYNPAPHGNSSGNYYSGGGYGGGGGGSWGAPPSQGK